MPDLLKIAYNACDPFTPATPEQWVDCNKERGSKALINRICHALDKTNSFVCFLVSGHFGCGKSSELIHLTNHLRTTPEHYGNRRFFPVYFDADDYLDRYDADVLDLLLAVATELGASFRKNLNVDLTEGFLLERLQEFFPEAVRQAKIEKVDLTLGFFKVALQRNATDKHARAALREKLEFQEQTLVTALNVVFEQARLALRQKGYDDLVLLLDNLEKIRRTRGEEDVEKAGYKFFIGNAPLLTNFSANVVYTVPIRLVSANGGELKEVYGIAPFVIPMIKVVERDRQTPVPAGYVRMRELLLQHLKGYMKADDDDREYADTLTLEELIDPDAIDLLIRYSGGSARELMRYVKEATSETESVPISRQAARAALQSTVETYSRTIAARHWAKLAQLELSEDQQIDNDDEDYRELLTEVAIMVYRNGGVGDSFSVKDEPWYGVHPIVRELSRFKSTVAALTAERSILKTANGV